MRNNKLDRREPILLQDLCEMVEHPLEVCLFDFLISTTPSWIVRLFPSDPIKLSSGNLYLFVL